MTRTPWTPGPWRAQGKYVRSDASDEALRSVGKRGRTVADCRLANGRADARLIAAAPEYDDMLGEAIALIDGDLTGGEWKKACRDFVKKAKDLRAKARGEA